MVQWQWQSTQQQRVPGSFPTKNFKNKNVSQNKILFLLHNKKNVSSSSSKFLVINTYY